MTDLQKQAWIVTVDDCSSLFANNGQLSTDKSRCSSGAEHFLGKEEVVSSILINGSSYSICDACISDTACNIVVIGDGRFGVSIAGNIRRILRFIDKMIGGFSI